MYDEISPPTTPYPYPENNCNSHCLKILYTLFFSLFIVWISAMIYYYTLLEQRQLV